MRRLIRKAEWSEVLYQFAYKTQPAAHVAAQVKKWADAAGFDCPELGPDTAIYLEEWHGQFIAEVMEAVKDISPLQPVKRAPRHVNLPMTFLHYGGRYYVLDGKHRAHVWAGTNDWYETLVIYPDEI